MARKIILVHGLGGTADGTWGKFPKFLKEDKDIDFDIITCGYQSPSLWEIWKRAPSILNIANGVLTDIKARCNIENDEIILAGHSLGGIIIKKVLLLLENKRIQHKIEKICFFDVPHDGSGYANVGKYITFRNRHLKSLCRDSSELDDLNDQWVSSNLGNSLRILSIIAANDDIVSSSSAKSIFRGHDIETINDADHLSIVKPDSTNSLAYIVFKNFILKKNLISKYKSIKCRDINDWKSIERNHSFNYATDAKRSNDLESLISALEMNRSVIRLTGASGLGKTRLLLEAIESSSTIDDSCALIFNAPGYEKNIKESIRKMVEDGVHGLAIIENCSIDLHNHLAKEVKKTECLLKIVTIGYSDEKVDDSIHIKLSPLTDDAIKQVLLPILSGMDPSDIDRVAKFTQGYPLMATLIAEQYQKEGRLLGSIESASVVKKLIEGDGGITPHEKEVLSACSLFDVFGTAEGTAGDEARFITEDIAGTTLNVFDRVLRTFTARQIINRAGKYARVVPKPLALTLASEWWEEASYERQKKLIDTLPDSLMHSFCIQASYLDNQPSVQRFSDRLFGGQSPFIRAGELLTERGSKLFRAFVEVNPESTSSALYHVLAESSREQLQAIAGDTRRNLVWGLEKLCFHAEVFEKSAWCMLLLASAENEHWSNNATGMFAQLFRVTLSGTQAKPSIRFDLLKRAIDLNQVEIDMVVLEALNEAINIHGGTRTVGAEYQGTKAPLQEWKPDLWQEIFDFWQKAFDLMLLLFKRGAQQKEKVLSHIGHSIRGFATINRIPMLDTAIREIVAINGRYWPSALESIKETFEFDQEKINQEAIDALNNWLDLLNPSGAELPERLKILVTNPPWEHHKNEDGNYIDVAAQNAKNLATEVSRNIDELKPHLGLLLQGEQKQSYSFGYQLAHELPDIKPLINLSIENLSAIKNPNTNLITGLYRGLFEKSPEAWQDNIEKLLKDKKTIHLYPDLIRTGKIQKTHLETLLSLIQRGTLSPNTANLLCYGSVTDDIDQDVLADFCLRLAEQCDQGSWPALNVIYMYCFSNEGSITDLRHQLKKLVTFVPLQKEHNRRNKNAYHWHDMAKKLLKERDQEFAIALVLQLISASKKGLDHGDAWTYIKPVMLQLMADYGDTLWPIFGDAIIKAEGKELYWLQQLFAREISSARNAPSVLSALPTESIIEWCKQFPQKGPIFVARCLNILDTTEENKQPSELFIALLENFGSDQNVANELAANMASRGWSGSLVPHLKLDKSALTPLLDHGNQNIRRWVKDHIANIDRQILKESMQDEEQDMRNY